MNYSNYFTRAVWVGFLAFSLAGCVALGIGAAGGAAAGGIASERAEQRHENYSAGNYVVTVLSNVVYVPAKVIFAGAGAATSGVAYLVTFGDRGVSRSIWDASTGGDYLVTPGMVAGEKEVQFVGG